MAPYTEKNNSKQTIRTKSIRFGYKYFALCSADCYPCFIDPYFDVKYGGRIVSKNLCTWSVIDCITEFDNWHGKKVSLDNWFSSLLLITVLNNQDICAMETVRTDCTSEELKLNQKIIKMEVRDTIKCHYEKICIGVICWKDNSPVTVISNIHADLPLTTVKNHRNHRNQKPDQNWPLTLYYKI